MFSLLGRVGSYHLSILKINFIKVQLIYNVVLVSDVQRSDSVTHMYIYTFFFRFFSIISYYQILSIVLSAVH